MLANGVPLVTVSKILGHSSPAVTAQIYAHALDESKAEAIAGLLQQLRQDSARITHTPQKRIPRLRLCSAGFRIRMLVPETGLEPVRGCPQRFLRPRSGTGPHCHTRADRIPMRIR